MEVLSRVGDSFLYVIFDSLFEKIKEYISDQLWDSEEIHVHMKSWMTLLPKITVVLQHAEENQVANQFVKSYLDDLRDLAYDMEDILEGFVIDAKRSKSIAESKDGPSKLQRIISGVNNFFSSNKAKRDQEINSMVMDLNGRLQKIENGMRTLGLIDLALKLEDRSHKVVAKRLPESSVPEHKVWGRDEDKNSIVQRLLKDGGSLEQDFVIPIVGMGGLGKTTLARLIYNDKKLEGKFDLKAWVSVSDEFDVARITRTILEQVTKKKCVLDDFSSLQEELKMELSGHKFLLVLDDVWNKEYGRWDVLNKPFMSGVPGSKIIVTTRNKDVGTMMRIDDGVYNLALLQDDACLPLFTRHALGKENFNLHPNLQDIGEKLVKRCKRLPLALKTLGGVLRGKLRPDEWENVLNSDIWSSSEDRSGILPALRLSYNHLPSHLKRCFAYCALFPKDYEFDKKELVLLWTAEGLLQQQSHEKKQMEEEIGHQYFDELFLRSLFQQSSGDESRFVMHDLINDLALDVTGKIYCNLERSMGDEKLEKARHLSFTPDQYEISERFIILDKLKHWRTFLPLSGYKTCSYLSKRILHEFLPTLNRLRVLSLHHYQISELPESFENLKHIRYIDLSCTSVACIPELVGSLLFLQTLLLYGCQKLSKLPMTIGNLIDLHHLDITDTPSLKEMPSGIGNLKNLVTLSKFIVGKASGMMMRLSDLKNLSQIRGRLSILNLQNVLDVQDAREANLDKIHGLEELVLEWITSDSDMERTAFDNDLDSNFDLERTTSDHDLEWTTSNNNRDELVLKMQVLGWLKPHSNLKSLKISCYGGENFPPWFRNMLNWKEWTSLAGSEGEFRCLHKLVIEGCPKLGQLPSNLSSLKELSIRCCNGVLLKRMVNLTSLTNLKIEQISKLICLPESFTQSCTALETLDIANCNDLTCLWEEGIEIEQSLLPFNLKHLSLQRCSALESLPDAMMMRTDSSSSSNTSMLMSRLERLEICHCDSLKSFPRGKLPTSLKYLSIENCEGLESLPDVDGDYNNSDLHSKICNLPCLYSSQGSCHQLPAFLKEFEVTYGGEWLESFPEKMLQHCTRLQSISIWNCKILKSLPNLDGVSKLVRLCIWSCEVLESIPEELWLCTRNLKGLVVQWCKNFKYLPNTMYQLESLQDLSMQHCPSIKCIPNGGLPPNLKCLRFDYCENLKCVPNSMCQLTSLGNLSLSGEALTMDLQNLTSLRSLGIGRKLPLGIVLPSSLTSLLIWKAENLESIPGGLFQNLSSLTWLLIENCPKLRSLPREAFPPSLEKLEIWKCPHLKRQRFEENGDYWNLTWSIPCVRISE
ncbi:hypothetical protein SLEP1_g53377 [Rubroshorea leprosula]|uniref:Disease resistance RPP13-like protein 1 n=1 Tax=Rubroshorea leprosula TaxID=152421 RepID=A0AAV5MC21_9ROSI|nr:hypothetical protein SLEP1_g53377 [Rubroshorea leprosula]